MFVMYGSIVFSSILANVEISEMSPLSLFGLRKGVWDKQAQDVEVF